MLRSGMTMNSGGNGGDEGSVLSVGNSLLSALANLARNYYTTTPSLLWKSEKIPGKPSRSLFYILYVLYFSLFVC